MIRVLHIIRGVVDGGLKCSDGEAEPEFASVRLGRGSQLLVPQVLDLGKLALPLLGRRRRDCSRNAKAAWWNWQTRKT